MSRNTIISIAGVSRQQPSDFEESDFDALPQQKPILQKVTFPPRLSLNGILISLLCTLLLVMMGFITINIPSPLNIGTHATAYNQLTMIQYTFQIPMALFVGAFLGPFMGVASVLLLLVIGLAFFPIFANGGGWHYTLQPGFGYLLGALIVAYLLGKSFYKAFQKQGNASRSLKIFLHAVSAVLLVHILGVAYLVGLTVAGQIPLDQLPGWILRLTIETMPYDMLATAVFLCLVRQVRLALWLVLY